MASPSFPLPQRIVAWRKKRNWSQKKLAAAIDRKPSQICRYESGDVNPPESVVAKIADVLAGDMASFYRLKAPRKKVA